MWLSASACWLDVDCGVVGFCLFLKEVFFAMMPTGILESVIARIDEQQWPTHCLYVVATPIGNLGDLGLRAWQALLRVDLIAAEDTRTTRPLLQAWGIGTPVRALHRHNEAEAAAALIESLQQGQRVALISDA